MANFIFEIGFEEFPPSFILPTVAQLKENILAELAKQRVTAGICYEFSTCSRIALVCRGLPEKQPDAKEKITGPLKKTALNDDGTLSKAAAAFLMKNGLNDYFFEKGKKGEVIAGWLEEKGLELCDLIPQIVKSALKSLNFKKSMRWGEGSFAFARPIRWIFLSINGLPVKDNFEGIDFSETSFGHRFLSNGALAVDALNYAETMRAHSVFVDRDERKKFIRESALEKAKELRMIANIDENLLEEVVDMTERPYIVIGNISEEYKNLPVELVAKVLQKDQRYFTLCEPDSLAVTKFASVLNNIPADDAPVVKGSEKVVAARLSDAAFYFNDDLSKDFYALKESLKGELFQKELGSYYDKIVRIGRLSEFIAKNYFSLSDAELKKLKLASEMIKNDLTTGVVFEFPDLQGIMGRYYAARAGFEDDVCAAMYEHYLPVNAGDPLPKTLLGSILSMADKIDTVAGGFTAGMEPTGSKDKFAIRRNASGFLLVALNLTQNPVNISEIVNFAVGLIEAQTGKKAKAPKEILDFIRARYNAVLNFETPVIQAAVAKEWEFPLAVKKRAETMAKLVKESNIAELAQLYKRGRNILKREEEPLSEPDETLFEQGEERALFAKVKELSESIKNLDDSYEIALKIISLKPALDAFFDAVFVMCEDRAIRRNRMNLIGKVAALVADNIGEISFLNI